MLKILHIDSGRELRGGQHQLLLLARGLAQRGADQLIVCPEASPLAERVRREGWPVVALPEAALAHGRMLAGLRGRLRADRFDLLHAHDGRSLNTAWLVAAGLAMHRVASRRVAFVPRSTALLRFKYSYVAHAIITVSEHVHNLLTRCGVARQKIHVIPDGVEIPSQPPDAPTRRRARAALRLGEREFVVGHVGAFSREKGQDVALDAVSLLTKRLPTMRLLLAVCGSCPAEVGAQPNVTVLDAPEDLWGFFAGLDLYIMPSRQEGLGSSAILAMAHGLPVVASRTGGLPEVVNHEQTGWLVEPGSPEALAEAIVNAAANPGRVQELGRAARERARAFSAERMVDRTLALYRRLVGHPAA